MLHPGPIRRPEALTPLHKHKLLQAARLAPPEAAMNL